MAVEESLGERGAVLPVPLLILLLVLAELLRVVDGGNLIEATVLGAAAGRVLFLGNKGGGALLLTREDFVVVAPDEGTFANSSLVLPLPIKAAFVLVLLMLSELSELVSISCSCMSCCRLAMMAFCC